MTEELITPSTLDELEAFAKGATPGPWESWNVDDESIEVRAGSALEGRDSYATTDMIVTYDVSYFELEEQGFTQREADADFIAAANPRIILALIAANRRTADALEAVTAERDEANHAAARHKSDAALFEAESDRLKAALNEIQAYADRKGTFGFSELHKLLSAALNEGEN